MKSPIRLFANFPKYNKKLGEDSCSGDSGGPLVKEVNGNMFLVGLVSGGSARCGTGKPGFYTKMSAYKDWILTNMRE